jgi:6-phospho-3-hexuloisomerase
MTYSNLVIQTYSPNQTLILKELEATLAHVSEVEIAAAQKMILAARRVFVTGAGRSGLALKMAAMRLMHLGLTVHVAGEVTTPAIGQGDLLLVASGSGTTAGAVHAGGRNAAAAWLGVARTTLIYKMKRLGILTTDGPK